MYSISQEEGGSTRTCHYSTRVGRPARRAIVKEETPLAGIPRECKLLFDNARIALRLSSARSLHNVPKCGRRCSASSCTRSTRCSRYRGPSTLYGVGLDGLHRAWPPFLPRVCARPPSPDMGGRSMGGLCGAVAHWRVWSRFPKPSKSSNLSSSTHSADDDVSAQNRRFAIFPLSPSPGFCTAQNWQFAISGCLHWDGYSRSIRAPPAAMLLPRVLDSGSRILHLVGSISSDSRIALQGSFSNIHTPVLYLVDH